jgi:ferredoxin
MIKAKSKPIKEILKYIAPYQNGLIVGCGGCVSVCLAGGQKEVGILQAELELSKGTSGNLTGYTVERQCNEQYLGALDDMVKDVDCILSMACGAGVQFLAARYLGKPVFPALNTIGIGVDLDVGLYEEKCRACGECVLAYTAGVCPVTRCAKSLFNGPCGGTNGDKCEVRSNLPCAWHEIYTRLTAQGRLDNILEIQPPMQWQNQVQSTIIQKGYEQRYYQE